MSETKKKKKNPFLEKKRSNDYKNITRTIENLEKLPEHLTYEMARGLYENNIRIDKGLIERAIKKLQKIDEFVL